MRKLLVTILTLCLLGGQILAGQMSAPPAAPAAAAHLILASTEIPCDHHQQKHLPGHGEQKSGGMKCCLTGQCPMLGQGVVPSADLITAFYSTERPVPPLQAEEAGIPVGPDLRPPRYLI